MKSVSIKKLYNIALEAGKAIMDVYYGKIEVEIKEDNSPLTIADKMAHKIILEGLQQFKGDIPVLSEEGSDIPYSVRKEWNEFWLVDPLDGTKEFIKKNNEFTVNIALIVQGFPVLGVIYAPALDIFYFGQEEIGSFKLEKASELIVSSDEELISKSIKLKTMNPNKNDLIRVVASRSHLSIETQEFIDKLNTQYSLVDVTSAGSSLKFCLVAEGIADFYPRYAPTMEWDTAAGQAIVEASGGKVIIMENKSRLVYNKENLVNEWFLVCTDD